MTALFAEQTWSPTQYTPPLSATPLSDGDRLIELVEKYWLTEDGQRIVLDDWQKALIIAVLERFPLDWPEKRLRGALRYRQVVISMGRQNGKSLLGGIFALYGLLQHVRGCSVIGVATSVEQANVVYERVKYAVTNQPALNKKLKPTGTRGIRHRDGSGAYLVKPALEEGLQSVPVTLAIADELHLSRASMWDSIVNGQRSKADALLIGITTAGDDTSELLKRLYKQGERAIAEPDGRFGFFLWQADEGASIDDDAQIKKANPSIASGRIDIQTVKSDVRDLPDVDRQRYLFNRFVASINGWMPMASWIARGSGGVPQDATDVVFSIDRSPGWEYASIVAASKDDQGMLHTELVASINKPNLDQLEALCVVLASKHTGSFVVDGRQLGALGKRLKERGFEVKEMTLGDQLQACSMAYASIVGGKVTHADDQLLRVQMPRARRKNVGESWRVARDASTSDIDGVIATIQALYWAETKPKRSLQLF